MAHKTQSNCQFLFTVTRYCCTKQFQSSHGNLHGHSARMRLWWACARVYIYLIEFAIQFMNNFTFNWNFLCPKSQKKKKHFDSKSIKTKLYSLSLVCVVLLLLLLLSLCCCELNWLKLSKEKEWVRERGSVYFHPFVTHLKFRIIMRK